MKKSIFLSLTVTLLLSCLISACQEGPAEKKGKTIDNAVENLQDKIQHKGPAQKAGEKLDKAAGN